MLLFLTKFDTLYFIGDLDAACTHGNQFVCHLIHADERRYHFSRDIVFQVYYPSHIASFKKIGFILFRKFMSEERAFKFRLLPDAMYRQNYIPVLVMPERQACVQFHDGGIVVSCDGERTG